MCCIQILLAKWNRATKLDTRLIAAKYNVVLPVARQQKE